MTLPLASMQGQDFALHRDLTSIVRHFLSCLSRYTSCVNPHLYPKIAWIPAGEGIEIRVVKMHLQKICNLSPPRPVIVDAKQKHFHSPEGEDSCSLFPVHNCETTFVTIYFLVVDVQENKPCTLSVPHAKINTTHVTLLCPLTTGCYLGLYEQNSGEQ